jgi:hypothetical protein
MPITISYGNPALVGAASFAIGREKGRLKAGAQAAKAAQGALDRRDDKEKQKQDRFDRLGKENADRQQRGMTEAGRMANSAADRQARQDAGTAKANSTMQGKKDAWANKQNEKAAKDRADWDGRERKRREEHEDQGPGSELFGKPGGEYNTPEWDPMPQGGGMPMPQGGGGMPGGMPQGGGGMPQGGGGMPGGMPGMGGQQQQQMPDYPTFRNTQSNRRGFNPRRTQGANSAIRGRYQRYQREWRQDQQAMQGQASLGQMPQQQPGGQPPQPGGQPPQPGGPPQEYGPIGGGEFEVEMGLTQEQNKRIQDIRTWKGQIDSNPAMDYDQKNEAHMNADQMLEDASVPQAVPKKPNPSKMAWENDVFQTPEGAVAMGPDGMPTFMQGGKETPEEKRQAESQALGLAYAGQMNADGTPRYSPEEIPFAVADAMDKNPGDRLRVPTPFEESYPNYQSNDKGAHTSPVMPEADAIAEMQGMDPEKYNAQINKSGDGRAQLTVREIPQEPMKTEDKTKEKADKKAEDEKYKSRGVTWDEFRKDGDRRTEAGDALAGEEGEPLPTQDEIDDELERRFDKYEKRHADNAKKRKTDAEADAERAKRDNRPFSERTEGMKPSPVLDAAIEASGGPTETDTTSIPEAPPLSPAAQDAMKYDNGRMPAPAVEPPARLMARESFSNWNEAAKAHGGSYDNKEPFKVNGETFRHKDSENGVEILTEEGWRDYLEDDAPAVDGPFANSDKPREQSADVALGKAAPQWEKDEYNLKSETYIQGDLEKKYGGDPAQMSNEDMGLYIESLKRAQALSDGITKRKDDADRKKRQSKTRK